MKYHSKFKYFLLYLTSLFRFKIYLIIYNNFYRKPNENGSLVTNNASRSNTNSVSNIQESNILTGKQVYG